MKKIDDLFEENNKNKFSFLLLAKDNVDHNTILHLNEKLKDKINVVSIKSSKYETEELEYAISKSHFVITGIGKTLDIANKVKTPTLVDVNSNTVEKTYAKTVDFFDPYRNEDSKPYYTEKELNLLVEETFKQLDRYEIDYVNFL
jgi:hypothetical protein